MIREIRKLESRYFLLLLLNLLLSLYLSLSVMCVCTCIYVPESSIIISCCPMYVRAENVTKFLSKRNMHSSLLIYFYPTPFLFSFHLFSSTFILSSFPSPVSLFPFCSGRIIVVLLTITTKVYLWRPHFP